MSFATILAVLPHAIQAAEFAAKVLKLINQPKVTKENAKELEAMFRSEIQTLEEGNRALREAIDRMPED